MNCPKYSPPPDEESEGRTCLRSEFHQSYPKTGPLAENMNFALGDLQATLDPLHAARDPIYIYILSTLDRNSTTGKVIQRGSAPNFQGGVVSLCTCKHWMRTFSGVREEGPLWIAGLTSRTLFPETKRPRLFYLMRVQVRYPSHATAWHALDPKIQRDKSATRHPLGDIYEPRENQSGNSPLDPFDPNSYEVPHPRHSHFGSNKHGVPYWQEDIAQIYQREYVLLFGDPLYSFLWENPDLVWGEDSGFTQGQRKRRLGKFLEALIDIKEGAE